MDQLIRDTLNNIFVENEDIITEPIPSNMILGLDEASDDFVTLIRYAMPVDGGDYGDPSYAWMNELPLVVLRVRDTQPGRLPGRSHFNGCKRVTDSACGTWAP